MDDRSTDTAASPSAPEPPRQGAVHSGPGPRLRRAGRTAAIIGVLAFVGLLTFLSAKYSHEIGRPTTEDAAASAVAPTAPLSAERIEEFARRRLQEQLRAAKPSPPPPILDPLPETASISAQAPPPPLPPSSRRISSAPQPSRSSLDAPLVPALSSSLAAVPQVVNAAHPPTPDLPTLQEFLASAPSAASFADHSAPGSSLLRERAAGTGSSLLSAPEPLDRRAGVELPPPGVALLQPVPPPSSPTLFARTAIPLVLTHAVSTDVPGPIRAYVIRDVYDSLSSDVLLVPRGTLAIGHQAAHAAAGDQRILIIWTELKLPSGVSYRLPSPVAGSQDGTAGVLGDVDNHWWGRLGSAIGLSLVGAGIQLSQPQERTSVQGFAPDEGQVLAQQLGLELGRLSQEILRRGVNRPPTITLRPGERLSLLLTRDLAFAR